jgi:hypothetical protein
MFMLHRLGLFVFYFHGVFSLSCIVQLHDEARVLEEDWLMKMAAKPIQEKGSKKRRLKNDSGPTSFVILVIPLTVVCIAV